MVCKLINFLLSQHITTTQSLHSKQAATALKLSAWVSVTYTRYIVGRESKEKQLTMAHTHASSKKRRREPVNIDTKLVEIYEDLANEKDEIRLKAAQALVSQFTPDKKPTDEQIRKALQRLFRGLCSSRKAARIGFSIALTEILTQIFAAQQEASEITIPAVVGIWEAQSNASGSETGQVSWVDSVY